MRFEKYVYTYNVCSEYRICDKNQLAVLFISRANNFSKIFALKFLCNQQNSVYEDIHEFCFSFFLSAKKIFFRIVRKSFKD